MRSRTPPRSHTPESGGMKLFKGVLIGLVLGVALSAGTAVYVTHMPNPFVKKVDSVDSSSDKPINEMPDVSKHGIMNPTTVEGSNGTVGALITPSMPQPVVNTPQPVSPPAVTNNDAANNQVMVPGGVTTPQATVDNNQNAPQTATENSAKSSQPASKISLFVQTGAFKQAREAEDQRANLALIGVDANVIAPNGGQEKLYRVRIGPLSNMDEAHTLISTLKSNGFSHTAVVKEKHD
ncbi:SPOR domain-containing protein [Ferrovum sp. PN-J185]|uniref:SPOR domain-containing protein n=1 Tax=Ferrovum sp. PN-J185 TaxID=1356306 RepID=UPI001E396097|nr:SPOR domain-containing protein [Ferrovum sp. PN-J185]MCC6068710.1 SPOR domain-containing protein [Ferrovum sp. PN-J185]